MKTFVVNFKVCENMREDLLRHIDELKRFSDSPHLTVSNLIRLAIEEGLSRLDKVRPEAICERILTYGMRRGKPAPDRSSER